LHKQVVLEICVDPVFVIGAPRSGTSVLAWSLAQHTEFWTSPESDFLYWLFGRGRMDEAMAKSLDRTDEGWLARLNLNLGDVTEALGIGVNALISRSSDGRRWIDQSPTYTLAPHDMARLFPGARFLNILRDGRNVVNSMVSSGFGVSWASDFRDACRTWAHFVERAQAFAEARPTRCLTVHYSALVEDPTAMFARILTFLEAEQDPAPATFFKNNRINSSYQDDNSTSEYAAPADPWSIWTEEQRVVFMEEAGETMAKYFAPVA
jgi:hypothetical protein